MADKNKSALGNVNKDEIDILLKEYDTLRSEIIARTSGGFQLGAIVLAAITWMGSRPVDHAPISPRLVGALVAGIVALAFAYWRDLYAASVRVAELEREINHLAGRPLLKWEGQYGPGSRGAFGWLIPWRFGPKKPK